MGWLGIDTGGTFTAFVWYEPANRVLQLVKVPSNPADPRTVFTAGLRELGRRLGVADRGDRDLVEIGRQNRFEMRGLPGLRRGLPDRRAARPRLPRLDPRVARIAGRCSHLPWPRRVAILPLRVLRPAGRQLTGGDDTCPTTR
jgi:N-methylhydantoinase A/oxoprolinase/acetone carboxylase beta subunit